MTRVVRLLLYWVGAYVTLMAIFVLFGGVLDTLALPLRVLIVRGARGGDDPARVAAREPDRRPLEHGSQPRHR